jgi:hypothetical protein
MSDLTYVECGLGQRPGLAYQVLDDVHTMKVIRMWTHYE